LYKSNIRVYVGASAYALDDNLRGVRYSNPSPPPNTKLMDGWLFVNCGGGHGQAAFAFDTPWLGHGKLPHRIYWQKQPGTVNDAVDLAWDDGSGETYQAHGELGQDLLVKLLPLGVAIEAGHPAQATLPSLGLGE
jgi:hypothetical protein